MDVSLHTKMTKYFVQIRLAGQSARAWPVAQGVSPKLFEGRTSFQGFTIILSDEPIF